MKTAQDWVNQDEILGSLLIEIESMTEKTIIEQAEFAFHRICELYDLPKMPEDLERYSEYYDENDIDEPRSVFEEVALIKFLEPNDDPRGIVLAATFNVKHNIGVDLKEIMKMSFGKPKFGIKGEGINSEIVFIGENENWIDLDFKVLVQPL